MNKFILFALLAACVFAHPLHKRMHNLLSSMRPRDGRSKNTFTPVLPNCSWEVSSHIYVTTQGPPAQVVEDAEDVISMHGKYFRETMKSKIHLDETECNLGRPDLSNSSCFALAYDVLVDEGCEEYCISTLKEYTECINNFVEMFVSDYEYDSEAQGEFNGEQCTVYTYTDPGSGSTSHYYVNNNNKYLIGMESLFTKGDKEYNWTQTMTYKEYVPLSTFVIPSDFPDACSKKAYNPPTWRECEEPAPSPSPSPSGPSGPSGSQTSSAITVKATVAMIFASAVIALLHLF